MVNPQTSYRDAWTRSQTQIRKLIPLAAELKTVIAIEEVWNRFLLSPLEMDKYIREFHSPWIKAWFDVGNVLLYGYPQDWIRTLGKNTVKLHVKDFKRRKDGYAWVNLGDGDADWVEVRNALAEIGYAGSAIAELDGGDERYLRDVSQRMDRLILGHVWNNALSSEKARCDYELSHMKTSGLCTVSRFNAVVDSSTKMRIAAKNQALSVSCP